MLAAFLSSLKRLFHKMHQGQIFQPHGSDCIHSCFCLRAVVGLNLVCLGSSESLEQVVFDRKVKVSMI